MTGPRGIELRRISIRVALAATAVVALAYFAIAVAVFVIVTNDLTAQIDRRVASALDRFGTQPVPPPGGGFQPPDVGPRFGPTLLVWTVLPDGTVLSIPSETELPADYRDVTGPRTVSIEGLDVRVQGRDALIGVLGGDTLIGRVVVGQTMGSVAQAQATLVLAEIVIAPLLLLVVFVGAVAIGRRVAAPIEAARRRQLEFTADASHELRTPLSVIEAETSLALARDRDAPWYRDAFGRVDRESRRMRRLLDDLFWLARFDAASEPREAEPVDLGVLAAGAADRFRGVAEARGISLVVDVPPDPLTVAAPPDWLDRLLGVLLDNACKYSPRGGEVRVAALQAGNRVEVTVDDSGPGISAEERDRIFDRFHRAGGDGGGAGLGLAIGDAVVRGTGGRWRIAASPAGGAAMTVSWPALSRSHPAGAAGTAGAAREPDGVGTLQSPRS